MSSNFVHADNFSSSLT